MAPRRFHPIAFVTLAVLIALAVIHFHDGSAFRRPLLDYDDFEFIAPIEGMSVSTYLHDWMLKPNHYAFPLRDLTFAIDFKLSRLLGFKTFWIGNFILYLLTLAVLWRIFRLYYRSRPALIAGALTLIALHPIHVHMVEWLSNRKHLMVALILGWGTLKALERKVTGTAPSLRDWLTYFGVYVAAWLCFPSAALWIFWVLLLFHSQLWQTKRIAAALWSAAVALAGFAYYCSTVINGDYRPKAGAPVRPFFFSLQSTGRALFNLLFPVQLEPYYRLNHPLTWIGFALFCAGVALVCRRLRTLPAERRQRFGHLILLSLAVYIPNAKVFIGYTEYVWSDRYLHGCLPFFVLALLILFVEPDPAPGALGSGHTPASPTRAAGTRRSYALASIAALLALAYVGLDLRLVPRWEDGLALFSSCAREEGTPKCVMMAMEKVFDRTGCTDLSPLLAQAHRIAPTTTTLGDHTFRAEAALYDALCIAERRTSQQDKLKSIEQLRSVYTVSDHLMVGEILVLLQSRDTSSALGIANATYFNPAVPLPNASPKIINMIRGQGEALCAMRDATVHDKSCWSSLAIFQHRVRAVTVNPKQVEWAFRRSLAAYNDGI